ncbi:PHD finger protein 7 [Dryobates pubescens]|uniref:PHD finger protein 7 n=1 Tax=Dryobates pubescens TaxID=118200 RepID=UPI0023B8B784|nr:PHD finger protein 7 [Dryobates pubescens]
MEEMSDPEVMEQACQLCHRPNLDQDIYGLWQQHQDVCFHACCVYFTSGLTPVGFSGDIPAFRLSAIRRAIRQSAEKLCFVCGGSGASITCQESGCERSFHLPCATRGRCVTQYFEQYRAFCSRHRPQQAVLRDPEPGTDCLLCLEDVGDRQSFRTMVCPVCQHAWFHRDCIQGHALQAGISAFRCLLCRDKDQFQQEMLRMGIRIPRRPPEWETAQEFAALMERHSQCDAQHCLCPGGRGQAEEEGPWQLLLCSSCAAEGTHRCCSQLEDSTAQWECHGCAGPSNASSATLQEAGASTPRQPTQASSRASEAGEGCSSPSGPMRLRDRSRLQRRAQNPYSRPGRRSSGASSELAGASSELAAPSTASELPSGPSSPAPSLESSSRQSRPGPQRLRERSCPRRGAQAPYRRPSHRRRRR